METCTDPRTNISYEVDGGAERMVCLWPSGETNLLTIHDLCREIRDRARIDGAIPVSVYVRNDAALELALLNVVDHDDATVTVQVELDVTVDSRHHTKMIARGWYQP